MYCLHLARTISLGEIIYLYNIFWIFFSMGTDHNWQCLWDYWAFDLHIVFITILCWLTGTEPPLSAVSQMLTCSVVKWPFSPNWTVPLSSALWVLAWMIPAWVKVWLYKQTWLSVWPSVEGVLMPTGWAQCMFNVKIWGKQKNFSFLCSHLFSFDWVILRGLHFVCHLCSGCHGYLPVVEFCFRTLPLWPSLWLEGPCSVFFMNRKGLCVLSLSVKYCRLSYFHSIIHSLLCFLHGCKWI